MPLRLAGSCDNFQTPRPLFTVRFHAIVIGLLALIHCFAPLADRLEVLKPDDVYRAAVVPGGEPNPVGTV
jgi:hypothetical protein